MENEGEREREGRGRRVDLHDLFILTVPCIPDIVLSDCVRLESVGESTGTDRGGTGSGRAREGVRESLLDFGGFLETKGG